MPKNEQDPNGAELRGFDGKWVKIQGMQSLKT